MCTNILALYKYFGTFVKQNERQTNSFKNPDVMRVHYVLFDGTSHYVTDEQDMLNLTKKDKDIEVVFKSMNFDIACDKADELNELL